ncbi:MAG: hypothetical protein IJ037_00965 [Clostridia bacterium]|nr:hypothetical protein [Clostridia bacterium]MBQ8368422.1 hypothetical protein [Clostridia bacterium]
MVRRLKREVCFLIGHYKTAGLCAFLCCMGGVLLWVSGGSWMYHVRPYTVPIGVMFLLWLTVYGFTGLLMAVLLLSGRCRCGKGSALTAAAYVCMLCWYAVFFCTPLTFFAGLLLSLSVILLGIVFLTEKRSMLTVKILIFLIEGIQIWCLYRCFFMNLLN